jgi:DNA-binding GntR family transcriptional regulator
VEHKPAGAGERGADPEPVFSSRHDRRKVTDWVYEELREAILDLRLQPGEPLREAAIAEQLGVSKTPIREALTRLEQEGLVETTSFKGAVVSAYSRQDLIEIYELRELLEGAAAREAAASISDDELSGLEALIEKSRALQARGDMSKLAEALSEFDVVIFGQVENRRIRSLIENLQAHLERIGKLTAAIPGRIEASVDEHDRIVRAIRARDTDESERSMRAHIRSVMRDQLQAANDESDASSSAPA